MSKRRKQGLILLLVSVPMMWWGYSSFMDGTTNSSFQAIAVSLSCTLGSLFAISGLTMLITKNSLGIWNPDDKGKKDRGVVLASQANVGDSSVQKEIINKPSKKVNEMAKAKDTNIDKSVEEIRALEENLVQSEEIIKKETLNTKTTTEKIAVLKHDLAKDKTVKELLAIVTDYQLKQ